MTSDIYTCKNGLKVITCPNNINPIVSIQICVESGSVDEGEFAGSGISHLIEHMVFKGTKEYTCDELTKLTSSLGGMWNAYTSSSRTVFYITGPSEHYKQFIHILTQLVFHPVFPKEEFEPERNVIRREMDMCYDKASFVAYFELMKALYSKSNRKYPVIGYENLFNALTYENMVSYHKKHYVPKNTFICISGDIDEKEIYNYIEKEVEDIKAVELIKEQEPKEQIQLIPRTFRKTFQQPSSTIMMVWRVPAFGNEGYIPAYVLASILGADSTSYLYTLFHNEKGLVHDIGSWVLPSYSDYSILLIEAEVDEDKRDQVREEILNCIDNIHLMDFLEEESKKVYKKFKLSRMKKLETAEGCASSALNYYNTTRNPNYEKELEEALNHVSSEDMKKVAAKYLTRNGLTEVIVDPEKEVEEHTDESVKDTVTTYEETLENGIKVVIRQNKDRLLNDFVISFGAGCSTESKETAGINALMASCVFKGTEHRTLKQINDAMSTIGSVGSYAGHNTLSLYSTCLNEDIDEMCNLISDLIVHPTFPEDQVSIEKDSVISYLKLQSTESKNIATSNLLTLRFGAVSYGNPITGTPESISNITRDMLISHSHNIFCGNNASICISTSLDKNYIINLLNKYFSNIRSGVPVERIETPKIKYGDEYITCNKEQAVIAVGLPGCCARSSYDLVDQFILEEWLNDMSGPLFKEIREKRGLAYYVKVDSIYGIDTGCIIMYVITSADNVKEARDAFEKLLQKILVNGISMEDFEKAKAVLLSKITSEQQSESYITKTIAIDLLLGNPANHFKQFKEHVKNASIDRINNFIETYMRGTRTTVTVVPEDNK